MTRLEVEQRVPIAILAAALLFNLGQGVLRPSMPLYLQRAFGADYRMVTYIPVVFGAGKWVASLPTGYLLRRLGRPLMILGLLLIAMVDVGSISTSSYRTFVTLRALGGVGWAMFATVATTAVVNVPATQRRGRAVSVLLMSEASGLLLGSALGGWLYQQAGATTPFLFEAACMVVAAVGVGRWAVFAPDEASTPPRRHGRRLLAEVLRTPGIVVMGVTSAVLMAIQTGAVVFLFPLYLFTRAGVDPATVGLLVSLSVVGRLVALWLGGSVSDRVGRMRVLAPGLLAYAVLLGSISFLTYSTLLGVVSFAIGAAAGFVATIPTALTGDRVPRPLQGVAIGWIRTMTDSGQIAGPLVMGFLADAMGLATPFVFGALLLATMATTAWQCHRRERAMLSASTVEGSKP
jgi:MFS family permease